MIKIYHNPRCGKSREAIQLLEDDNQSYEIIKYLEKVPTKIELIELIRLLNIRPIELVRTKEKIWLEQFKNKILSDDDVINILSKHPILIERPIVINNKKAIIGRPPSSIKKIL